MATRKEILMDIREQAGNALSKSEVMRYLGKGKDATNVFLAGLPSYALDKHHKVYLAIDLAHRIAERQKL